MNYVFEYVWLNENLREINRSLIKEKRKTKRQQFSKIKRKILKKLKIVAKMAIRNLLNYPEIYLVDSTAISIKPIKHKRYLENYKLNFLIAYNFKLGYGWALLTETLRIRRKDMEKLHRRIKANCKNAIVLADSRNKYANCVDKTISQTIERLFSWIKKPIYPYCKDITFDELLDLYKMKFEQYHIIPINF
jgi:hypothetical protein